MIVMYPDQQLPTPNQTPPPATYLDQIAAQPTATTLKPWQLWSFIGGVLLLLIIVVVMLMNAGGSSQATQLTHFVYRVNALKVAANDNEKNIKNSHLVASNAQMQSILAGISQESNVILANNGVKKLPEVPKGALITTEFDKLSSKLDDARLNAVFDRTYAREIAYQLATLRAEIVALYTRSNSESTKAFLKTSDTNLEPLEKQFANFNDTQN